MKVDFNTVLEMMRMPQGLAGLSLVLACSACTSSDPVSEPLTADEVAPVAQQYARMVETNYGEAWAEAVELRAALGELVAAPSEASLTAARQAWLVARDPYVLSEAYRFYDGPIDGAEGPEGRLNAWPMDEAYVDYVEGMPDAGIINDPATYPTIDAALIASLNEQGGETNIASGYHAIEFLLWGQDVDPAGPGARPYTDFVVGGTAANQDRRGAYLLAAGDLLVADLDSLLVAWDGTSGDNYRAEFLAAPPDEIVRRILLGIGSLSGAELAGERMSVALDTQDQEDEHSCFSDNTHRDIVNDARSIQNVYEGSYYNVVGPSIHDLLADRDRELADRLSAEMQTSVELAEAIPAPFDQAILEHREAVEATIEALRTQTETIAEAAARFDIQLALD